MKKLILRLLSRSESGALSFAARSALIGMTLAAAGRAFAGSSPSGGPKHIAEAMEALKISEEKLEAARSLLSEALQYQNLTEEEQKRALTILKQLDDQKIDNAN